ncbi:MAG: hypothetical protein ACR2NR_18485 [Solirubrobacteraceae bacterium]
MLSSAALHPLSALVLVAGLGGGAVLVAALAVVARRLLGLRVGPVRTFAAGMIGYTVAALVSAAISPTRHNGTRISPSPALIPVLVGVSVLMTMVLLVVGPRGGPEARRARARSVRVALADGGVTFVKLGQLLSTQRDLLSPDLVDELGRLQHQAHRRAGIRCRSCWRRSWARPRTRCSPSSSRSPWPPLRSPRPTGPA